jgi:periplasmic divalent cation tolerance protein
MECEVRLLYVTCPDETCARLISNVLLEERLVACTNLIPGMESNYWWEGKITMSRELVLIVKTVADQVARVTARIESLHPYEAPCVLSLNVETGSEPYLRWLKGSIF